MTIVKVSTENLQKIYGDVELYHDVDKDIYYSTLNSLSKILECHPFCLHPLVTVRNLQEEIMVETHNGLRKVLVLSENTIKEILKYIQQREFSKKINTNSEILRLLLCEKNLKDTFRLCKPLKKDDVVFVSEEIVVANFLKKLHENSGDEVVLQQRIELNYIPDMIIYTPSTKMLMAVEVEPYERRKHGLQQSITYAFFTHANPYLVTFGKELPCEKEQFTLARYGVSWLHLQNNGDVEKSKFITNFKMLKMG